MAYAESTVPSRNFLTVGFGEPRGHKLNVRGQHRNFLTVGQSLITFKIDKRVAKHGEESHLGIVLDNQGI
jgi:hypothetical protein